MVFLLVSLEQLERENILLKKEILLLESENNISTNPETSTPIFQDLNVICQFIAGYAVRTTQVILCRNYIVIVFRSQERFWIWSFSTDVCP